MSSTRILITNDDGIASPGLHLLAAAARAAGHDVVVAAPATQSSGSSAAITAQQEDGRIRLERREIHGLEGIECYAVEAAPALIALLAAHSAFGAAPDIVLSGVNRGANVGRAVLHSGTVGAALTAGVNGGYGLAVSLDTGMEPDEFHWATAADLAVRLIPLVLDGDPGTVLNLNVPNVGAGTPLTYREAPLAEFGVVQSTATEVGEGDIRLTVADPGTFSDSDSDAALLAAGFAPVSILKSVSSVPTGLTLPPLPS